jgi:hypothetical protein
MGGAIAFVQQNGEWSQLREFRLRGNGTSVVADADSITANVASYVPAGVYKLTADDATNSLFAISDRTGFRERIYAYKYLYRQSDGGLQKAQSSWSYWEFRGQVKQVLALQETLYVLMQYGTAVYLEKLNISDQAPDVMGPPYTLLLDRSISTETTTPAPLRVARGTYSAATRKTTWTLPFNPVRKIQAWSALAASTNGMVLLGETTAGNTITARGDWSAAPVYFGEVYEFRYRFSRFKYMRDIGGGRVSSNVMRTQLRKAKLRYHETGFFRAVVKLEHREDAVYTFDGTVMAVHASQVGAILSTFAPNEDDPKREYEGVFNIPILSAGDRAIVELHNDTAMPCKFSTCEWIGLVTGRAQIK